MSPEDIKGGRYQLIVMGLEEVKYGVKSKTVGRAPRWLVTGVFVQQDTTHWDN